MAGWLALVAQGPPWAGSWLSSETRVGGWGDSAPTTREGEVVRVIVVTVSWGGWAHKEGRALCVCVCVWWVRGQHISVPASGCWLHKPWLVGVGCL